MGTRVRFLVNPAAGAGRAARALSRIEAAAAAVGADVELSESASDLASRARRAAAEGVERVVAVGGDGTFHHALRGIVESGCELAVVPMGTGNDIGGIAGVPSRLDAALRFAIEGGATPYDLGEVSLPDGERHPFAVYCGSGVDSEVSRWARERPSHRTGGRAIYLIGALTVLRTFEPAYLTVEHDAGRFEGPAMLAVAANGYRFGGGMKVAPEADPRDGLLDLVVARAMPLWRLLPLLLRVYTGSHVGHPAIQIVRTRSARLAADRAHPLALDGEDGGELGPEGIEISIRPSALRLVSS